MPNCDRVMCEVMLFGISAATTLIVIANDRHHAMPLKKTANRPKHGKEKINGLRIVRITQRGMLLSKYLSVGH